MRTKLERQISYEDALRKEIQAKFPTLDADWAVYRCMGQRESFEKRQFQTSMPVLNVIAEQMVEEITHGTR